MTTETDSDRDPISGEPNTEGGSGDQQHSLDVKELANAIISQLDPIIDKKLQSQKDRRINQMERQLTEVQSQLADELKRGGISAQAANVLAERLSPVDDNSAKASSSPVGTQGTPDLDKSVLSEAGLREDDPDIVAFRQRTFANETTRMAELARVIARKNRPVSEAGVAVPGGASTAPEAAQLQEELTDLVGKPQKNPADFQRMREVTEKLRTIK